MSLLLKLNSNDTLTPTENSIATFILNNPNEAQKLSLKELADASYVSKPTVIRFMRKMGYENYHDFRVALQVELQNHSKESPIDSNFPFREDDSYTQIAENMGKVALSAIQNTISSIDDFTLKNTIDVIYNAKRIFIFAIGNCYVEAQIMVSRFSRINRHAILMNANSYPYTYISNLMYGDVVLIFSSAGKTLHIEKKALDLITKSNAKTILITPNIDFNLRKKFNYVLYIQNGEDSIVKNETFASQTSILLIINIIVACVFEKDYHTNSQTNANIFKTIKENYL